MQQTGPRGPDEQELDVTRGCGVSCLGWACRDDGRQGDPVQPFADDDVALLV